MRPGHWDRISGDRPDLGLSPTAPGTRYMGEVTAVEFKSNQATLETFQQEWQAIVKGKGRMRS